MPYSAKGATFYATNGEAATLEHGQPVRIDGVNGVALKQDNSPVTAGSTAADVIAKKEDFGVLAKGIVEVPAVEGGESKVGALVYITEENKLSEEEKEGEKEFVAYGRIVEKGTERGTGKGYIRVDLDLG